MNRLPAGISTKSAAVGGHDHSDGNREDFLYAVVAHFPSLSVATDSLPIRNWGDSANLDYMFYHTGCSAHNI